MVTRVTATEAARRFSDLVNRVRYAGESFLVLRNGEAMCRIEPPDADAPSTLRDVLAALESDSPADPDFAGDLQAVQDSQQRLPRSAWDS